jgi:hypothetical protein
MSDDRGAATGVGESAVADLLPRLKHAGCNLLVSGNVSHATTGRATRRLLGAPDLDRKRVLVRTPDAPPVTDLLPVGVAAADPDVRVFEYRTDGPGPGGPDAVAPSAAPGPSHGADTLDALGRRVSAAVDDFVSCPTGLVGGELRLSVSSLGPLVADADAASVERFLRRTTDAVADARGLGHVCSPGPRADIATLPLERLFDGYVDLRERARAEHRLSFPSARPTAWIDL